MKESRHNSLLDPDEILVDSVSALAGEDHMETRMERPLGRLSSIFFLACVGIGFFYLLARAGSLQIVSGETFFARSQENRFFTRFVYPPRGIIFDRFGTALAENIPSLDIVFERDEFVRARAKTLSELLDELGVFLNRDRAFFIARGFPESGNIEDVPSHVILEQHVSLDQVVALQSRLPDLPGVHIAERYQRVYRGPRAYSHVLGFIGRTTEDEIKARSELRGEETVGKGGIEAFYDGVLRGSRGRKIVETDSSGRETRFKVIEYPKEGAPLALTIDAGLQEAVYDVISGYTEGKKGASAVALDVESGAVLSLVSYPGFDINKFSSALSREEFDELAHDPLFPFFNRAIAGEFPSGSVIKPIIGAAALEEGIIDSKKRIYAKGSISVQNPYNPDEASVFRDWKEHGWIDFYDAIAQSANVYFYTIGGGYGDQKGLGISRIKKYAALFGLGARLGIDLPGEKTGLFPDPSYKEIANPNDPLWRVGDTYNVSIGQGGVKVTPLQMAAAAAAIAGGGVLYRPFVLGAVLDREGRPVQTTQPEAVRETGIRKESLEAVRQGMRRAVTSGTAWRLSNLPVAVAAKTGTAQAGSRAPHAWVVAFAPYERPEIAIAVMVEHAGEGATVAVPIMRDILEWYFTNR